MVSSIQPFAPFSRAIRKAWNRYWFLKVLLRRFHAEARRFRRADARGRAALKREWAFDLARPLTPILGVESPEA